MAWYLNVDIFASSVTNKAGQLKIYNSLDNLSKPERAYLISSQHDDKHKDRIIA